MSYEKILEEKSNWQGQWIWEENSKPDTWMCFRKKINIKDISKSENLFIAVDSKYWLWINGELVVFEGGLNRGPFPDCGYYDEIDIKKHIRKGENTFAVLVWYWGNEGRNSVDSKEGGFLFELNTGEKTLKSDENFKCIVHPGFVKTSEPHPSNLYGGHNTGFDAGKDIKNWFLPDFDDSTWSSASTKGKVPCSPWNRLFKRPVPMTKFSGLLEYEGVIKDQEKNTYTCRLPNSSHVTPYFKINSPEDGLVIDIRTDRYNINGGPGDSHSSYNGHRTEYITCRGVQEFEGFDWALGENVIYSFPEGVEVLDLGYRESGYNCEIEGVFESDDRFLEVLYKKAVRTLYVCMRDNYMDCPDRERGQWIGDVSSQVPQTFYVLGRNADDLTRKAIRDFIFLRNGDVLCGNIPGIHRGELPSQSLNAISEIGMISSFYENTGDINVLEQSVDASIDYLLLWDINEKTGLLNKREGDWYWADHGEGIDDAVIENCWYYSAASAVLKSVEITGRKNDEKTEKLQIIKNSIKENFEKEFFKGSYYSSGDYKDDRANALAVISGLAPKDRYRDIIEIFDEVYNSTPYMEGYVLEAMFSMGYFEKAITRMKKRYKGLVENENTTLWEDFEILGTRNHAWSGMPCALIIKYLAGIKTLLPGYERYEIKPYKGLEGKMKVKIPSVKGNIGLETEIKKSGLKMIVSSPEKTTAIIHVPVEIKGERADSLNINSHNVKISNLKSFKMNGIEYKSEIDGYAVFESDKGVWDIEVLM